MTVNGSMHVAIGIFKVGEGRRFLFYVNRLPLASVDIHGSRDPYFPEVHIKILGWCIYFAHTLNHH